MKHWLGLEAKWPILKTYARGVNATDPFGRKTLYLYGTSEEDLALEVGLWKSL